MGKNKWTKQETPERQRISLILVVAIITLTCTACGNLTRSQAKSQLDSIFKQTEPQENSLLIRVGVVSSGAYDKTFAVLSAAGYITTRRIKQNVWKVELTHLGQKAIDPKFGKYALEQHGDIDTWLVRFPLARYDHLDVTGIVEDGVNAKVEVSLTYALTPLGTAVKKLAQPVLLEMLKKDKARQHFLYSSEAEIADSANGDLKYELDRLLGRYISAIPNNETKYVKRQAFPFQKYDNGWKLLTPIVM